MNGAQWNGAQLKEMFVAGSSWLKTHMAHVNALNVFPVPDGDTGTNMFLTLQAAVETIRPYRGSHAGELAALASQGALMGARGNSGVILSQILDGFSEGLSGKETFSVPDFARALHLASNRAYSAVLNPVEGTILTIIREAARIGEKAARRTAPLAEWLAEVLDAARTTLRLTPELLPVLKEARVVDAGGQGLVYFLEGMHRHLNGLPVEADEDAPHLAQPAPAQVAYTPGFDYDVQFLIKGDNLNVDAIRQAIAAMGDCPLVVGNAQTVKVHVHVADPGVPLSYGVTQGPILDVVVENMAEQHRALTGAGEDSAPLSEVAVVCVAAGDGLRRVFQSLGAAFVIAGGQTMNPSADDFLQAIRQTRARHVLLLPNNRNILLTARQAASIAPQEVQVVPTQTIPQGISALLAFDPTATVDDNLRRMEAALAHVHTVEITRAVRDTTLNNLPVQKGDFIGLLDNNLLATGPDMNRVSLETIAHAHPDDLELVTIYYGQDCRESDANRLAALLAEAHPHLDVEIIRGEQPHYPYLISLE